MASLKVPTSLPPSASKLYDFLQPQPRSYLLLPYKIPADRNRQNLLTLSCSSSTAAIGSGNQAPQVVTKRKRTRYRKQYPGESVGITEEMRFVAMRLRNVNGKRCEPSDETESEKEKEKEEEEQLGGVENWSSQKNEEETWRPSKEGFLKFLVDSKLVFDAIERIVDESEDVSYECFFQFKENVENMSIRGHLIKLERKRGEHSCNLIGDFDAYFRKTGLERSESLEKDLEWFRQQELVIPQPSDAGLSYAKYLKEQAEKSAPLFLSHFYNVYFSHVAGGKIIVKQVSEKLLEGRELEFNRWESDAEELLKGVREKLNMLGEHWSRDEKNKCLKETSKAFKYMGQIVRLIIL